MKTTYRVVPNDPDEPVAECQTLEGATTHAVQLTEQGIDSDIHEVKSKVIVRIKAP